MSQDSRPQKQSIAFKVCAVLLALPGWGWDGYSGTIYIIFFGGWVGGWVGGGGGGVGGGGGCLGERGVQMEFFWGGGSVQERPKIGGWRGGDLKEQVLFWVIQQRKGMEN